MPTESDISDFHREVELENLLQVHNPSLAKLILKAVKATMEHNRPSAVNLIIKVARNKDDPRLIEVTAQEKIKAPKSRYSDLTSWDEVENLKTYKLGEDAGQEYLPGTEITKNEMLKLHKDLKNKGMSMTIRAGGESATLGKRD